ncbi:MAG: DUF4190 domain-containing protein [Acidimicrobiia bacterium]
MNETPPPFQGNDNFNNNQNQIPTPPPPPQVGNYYANQQGYGYPQVAPNDSGAVPALVFGILGLACCGIFGPVGLIMGARSRKRIKESNGTLGGDGLALAGFICGIIGTVSLVIGVIYVLGMALVAIVGSN